MIDKRRSSNRERGVLAHRSPPRAQQADKVYRIGSSVWTRVERRDRRAASRLRALGTRKAEIWVIEYREAKVTTTACPLTAELIALKVDVLVTSSTPGRGPPSRRRQKSYRRRHRRRRCRRWNRVECCASGGHYHGVAIPLPDIMAKRIELLRDAIPGVVRIAAIFQPGQPGGRARAQGHGSDRARAEYRASTDCDQRPARLRTPPSPC